MARLFNPRGVAVVGASTHPGKIGYRIVENMVKSGYTGQIYPINPKGGEILGQTVYRSLADVPGAVDVAVLSIPADHVLAAVADCAAKGVGYLVIVTSGFAEIGNIAQEKEIVSVAHAHGMRVLGPNIFGIYSASSRLDATFGPGGILPGHVAIITQSGALGIAMIGKTAAESLGLSALISVGNKSDIDEADLLTYLAEDPETRVVLLYIEGVKNGERLVRTLRHVTKRKHVVVIKSGRSARGAMAAASHTGSLAGADDVFEDIMRQCGVLRAESVQEAFHWVRFLATAPLPSGEDAVIVTNGGGIGVLATDACEKYGVRLYDNQPMLATAFAEVMPEFGSSKNPVDLTGQATGEDYARSLDAVFARADMHAAIALYCETALFDTSQFATLLRSVYRKYESTKPIVFALFGGARIETLIRELRSEGIPVFGEQTAYDIDLKRIRQVLGRAGAEGRGFLLAHEAAEVALALGLRMPRSILSRDLDEAVRAAETLGYPVVMKIVSKDIVHKSDAGGVALGLENRDEVVDAYQAIIRSCLRYKPDAVMEGVEVVEMVRPGVETIVGARQDPSFGPVAMFGLGGIYVEVMKDVSFRAAPITARVAREMIGSIRSYPLLLGVRGERRKDIAAAADVVMRLGQLIAECREITDMEVNPLMVYDYGEGVKAVDVRILFHTQGGDAA
jgi:acetyl coenzyme A synthetase (ADP forming)-like protein